MPSDPLPLAGVSIDSSDPTALAQFYIALVGARLLWQNDSSAAVRTDSGLTLVAQKVADYVRPEWPMASILHIDLDAGADLEGSVAHAIGCGATEAIVQTDARWRVMLDPDGHPFCITTEVYRDSNEAPEKAGQTRRKGRPSPLPLMALLLAFGLVVSMLPLAWYLFGGWTEEPSDLVYYGSYEPLYGVSISQSGTDRFDEGFDRLSMPTSVLPIYLAPFVGGGIGAALGLVLGRMGFRLTRRRS